MARYKYSGPKTKVAPRGDFRKHKPKLAKANGGYRWHFVAEQKMGGRWEGFVGLPHGKRVFKTKAEALKHAPKW